MKKNYLLLVLLCGLFFTFCSKDELPSDGGSTTSAYSTMSLTRSAEEALVELDAVLADIASTTRSISNKTYSIDDVMVAGGSLATRGETGVSLPDTLVYVVNFDDDKGFAVLGAQRDLAAVYVVTESGSFNVERLNEAITNAYWRFLEDKPVAAENRANTERFQEIGVDIVPELLAESIVGGIVEWKPFPGGTSTLISVSYSEWETKSIIGPFVQTKWSQDHPFDMSCPPDPIYSTPENTVPCAVGCVMVGLGQVLACNRKPVLAPTATGRYNWNDLLSVANYLNFNNFSWNNVDAYLTANPIYAPRCKHLADFLYFLGGKKYCNAVYASSTSAYSLDAVKTMKLLDPVFYKSARLSPIEQAYAEVYQMLDDAKPVYIEGFNSKSGHVWVIDGYLNRSRTKCATYDDSLLGLHDRITFQNGKLLHCNFGWLGYCDGYYEPSIFHPTKVVSRDEIIDQNVSNGRRDVNYSWSNSVILY